jgi:hypothetical protein
VRRWSSPSGRASGPSFGKTRIRRLRPPRLSPQALSLPVGSFRQDATVVGGNRGQVLVENLKRAGGSREGSACPCACQIPGAPLPDLSEVWWTKCRRDGPGKPGPRHAGTALERHKTPMRASARAGRGPRRVRTSVGSKALEPRGIVNFWSSEQERAMPGTAGGQGRRKAYGSTEGKRSAG